MKIRIIFECTGCGSTSYRPSTKWTFKDSFLQKFGIWPQRCYRCRRRFYLYRPSLVDTILRALAAPPPLPACPAPEQPEIARAPKVVKTDVVWSTFAEADQSKRRP